MSILNDDRRISDDIWEFSEWQQEVKREYAREQYEQDHPYEVYADEIGEEDEDD